MRWVQDQVGSGPWLVEVDGLEAAEAEALKPWKSAATDWTQLLAVHVLEGDLIEDLQRPAVLGVYEVEGGRIRFTPRFPWTAGVTYSAAFHPEALPVRRTGGSRATVTARHQVPFPDLATSTAVAAIFPTAEVLPENLLKFYVQFSAPMSGGHIYDHLHLLDDAGRAVELPFLEIDEELWDPGMTRLTLFIDPGRIKRGVKPLEDVGPALVEGHDFTLVIDRAWRDARGQPLRSEFRKAFRVGPPDREPIDPSRWRVQSPAAKGREPVQVEFGEPMDAALARRLLHVTESDGHSVEGSVTLEGKESKWKFVPSQSWRAGTYQLIVPTILEDLAGNNVGKAFDVDLVETAKPLVTPVIRLSLEIR